MAALLRPLFTSEQDILSHASRFLSKKPTCPLLQIPIQRFRERSYLRVSMCPWRLTARRRDRTSGCSTPHQLTKFQNAFEACDAVKAILISDQHHSRDIAPQELDAAVAAATTRPPNPNSCKVGSCRLGRKNGRRVQQKSALTRWVKFVPKKPNMPRPELTVSTTLRVITITLGLVKRSTWPPATPRIILTETLPNDWPGAGANI